MEKRLFNLKNTRKTSINNKQPFSTVRSKYFPSKISNLSVSFSSVTQMHWKPLTCWITALHPHVFRLFWFASSPRTSVQTHFQKKKGKKRSIPGDKAFQATTISAMCVCETPTSLLYQHQGTKATQPLHFDEFLV